MKIKSVNIEENAIIVGKHQGNSVNRKKNTIDTRKYQGIITGQRTNTYASENIERKYVNLEQNT